MNEASYLHSYSATEQKRLFKQAQLLEPYLYKSINFSQYHHLLEIGCGVGAQTQILLKKFPNLKIDSVDSSSAQIQTALKLIDSCSDKDRVSFHTGTIEKLNFKKDSFDCAYFCWVLEHTPSPKDLIKQVAVYLKDGALIVANEVHNASMYTDPHMPYLHRYWDIIIKTQIALGGDPFVGIKVPSFLQEAGFSDIRMTPIPVVVHKADVAVKTELINYFYELLMSTWEAASASIPSKNDFLESLTAEFNQMRANPDAIFYLTAIQTQAIKRTKGI